MSLIELQHISKSYSGSSYLAVNDMSLSFEDKKCYAILGASGCGKSTLLRLIAGLETPTDGVLKISGMEVASTSHFVPAQKRGVGMVFQNYALFPHMTVKKNIAFGLSKNATSRIKEMLELTELVGFEDRYPHELSGGQQQRVALARALAPSPKVLLLDEPFSNLDHHLKAEVRSSLKSILKKSGICSVLVTHSPEDALDMAEEIFILDQGKVLAKGSVDELGRSDNNLVKKYLKA